MTADDKLWSAAKEHVYDDRFDFRKMNLSGINTDGYAIYQMAKTIYTAKECIRMDEIADKFLIGDQAFKAIIHSILIAKYGTTVFQVKFK
jgi:predicted acetyltransferase